MDQSLCSILQGEFHALFGSFLSVENILIEEVSCWGLGNSYCDFKVNFKSKEKTPNIYHFEFVDQKNLDIIQNSIHHLFYLPAKIKKTSNEDWVHSSLISDLFISLKYILNQSQLVKYSGYLFGQYVIKFPEVQQNIQVQKNNLKRVDFLTNVSIGIKILELPFIMALSFWRHIALKQKVNDETVLIEVRQNFLHSGLLTLIPAIDKFKFSVCDFIEGLLQVVIEVTTEEDIIVETKECCSLGDKTDLFQIQLD